MMDAVLLARFQFALTTIYHALRSVYARYDSISSNTRNYLCAYEKRSVQKIAKVLGEIILN